MTPEQRRQLRRAATEASGVIPLDPGELLALLDLLDARDAALAQVRAAMASTCEAR